MTLLERVRRRLEDERIGYALIGAAALAARGIARSTYDIDILTADVRVLASAMWEPVRVTGAVVEIRRGDHEDPLGGVVRIDASGERPVDIVLGKWAWQTRAVQRAEAAPGGPPIVAARDLVLLKLYAGGTQDLWDVRALLALPDADRLIADVEADLRDLPADIHARWTEARR